MSTTQSYTSLIYEVAQSRARITLNRPEKKNAISVTMQEELERALWDADNDTRVHCVILKGSGSDFCSGYDMTQYESAAEVANQFKRGRQTFDDDAWRLERAQSKRMALFDMHKPVIAQIHGRCLAGGTDLALLCDMVICSDDARRVLPLDILLHVHGALYKATCGSTTLDRNGQNACY